MSSEPVHSSAAIFPAPISPKFRSLPRAATRLKDRVCACANQKATMLSAPASCNDAFARSAAGSRASCNNVSDPSCSASAAAAAPSRASRRNGGTLRPAALSSRRITRIAAAGAQSSSSSSDSSGSERLDALQQRANQVKAMRAAANYLELLNDEDVDIDVSSASSFLECRTAHFGAALSRDASSAVSQRGRLLPGWSALATWRQSVFQQSLRVGPSLSEPALFRPRRC